MTFQTDDLQEVIFLMTGLKNVREFEQNQVDWCSNNRQEYNERYGHMGTVEDAIASHSSNVSKIDAMLAAAHKLQLQLTLRKAMKTTMPQSMIDAMQKQIDTMA